MEQTQLLINVLLKKKHMVTTYQVLLNAASAQILCLATERGRDGKARQQQAEKDSPRFIHFVEFTVHVVVC